MHNLKSNHL